MNQFEMVALIVFFVMVASIFRAKYGHGRRRGNEAISAEEHAETMRLREEVKALKDRIHVLERIAVEKEDTLSRQIEELRDR
jgi:Phage shock protein B.